MAQTASGWLIPADLSKRGVAHRALDLLGQYLDEDEREQVERYGGFAVASEAHVFWVSLHDTPWCAHTSDGRVEHLCIAPDRADGMPAGDVTLTYLLWIKFDPAGFLREANVITTKEIEWPDSDAELVKTLSDLARPAPVARRNPRKVTARQGPGPGACLDPRRVETIFRNHGKKIPPELLRKLTRG